ncbi:sigma-54-dependent Fis family transcriptional regulator [Tropicibacter sp. R15_0]|uniref:sigma-54-dependent Fis family transcriptional regulator n=1 Tax=Tropicibacter sp. R15_0 TaxID=2821101 RepID=UPI001ADD04DB|nr:sigma-54-dependent Fis family transcriptional regulator [Tropicibacter sp. R15_0]MBO9465635.1 sigma-54-dependent Fis family transcriptional regulator [Tropicibacter sp. R15_0]
MADNRKGVVVSGFMDRSSVDRLLQSSKDRSRSQHNLSSSAKSPILRLQADEIAFRNEKFLDQIGGAVSEVDNSALLPSRSRYCLLITDADGIVIESYAPEGLEAEFQKSGLVRGGVWDERVAGTNGISMSLQSGRVLTVLGDEHFYNCFHDFSCSSAPLTDAENNLIGTITLVGSARRRQEEHALCEQVVRRASRQFQTRLFRNFHADRLTGRLLSRDPKTRRSFETLVACDEDGTVISHLPLWRDAARPKEHQNLAGRHISDLNDLEITLRGPAAVPPRRRVAPADAPLISARVERETALGRLISEGGNLATLADRARKLVAHRVPLLICGEPGVGTDGFARALLEEQSLISPMGLTLDAADSDTETDLKEALNSLNFLSEYPVDNVVPTLILRNIESLPRPAQAILERFLDVDPMAARTKAEPPAVLFTTDKTWAELEDDNAIPKGLLYLLGQSVVELPPIAARDTETVLENVVAESFAGAVEIADNARDVLVGYHWPGNRREIRSVLREAMICGNGKRINVTDLPARLLAPREDKAKTLTQASLRDALDSTNWNVSKAARLLGKSRATVNRWIASEGLQRPE